MVPGIQIQGIRQSFISLTTVKTLIMEKQTHMEQDVVNTHMIGVHPQTTTPIHLMLRRCVASAEEVLFMTKPRIMAYGTILMAQLEPGPYRVMGHQVIGQVTMALKVVPGATKMATQHLATGLTLTVLNQDNGSQPLKIYPQDIWL